MRYFDGFGENSPCYDFVAGWNDSALDNRTLDLIFWRGF